MTETVTGITGNIVLTGKTASVKNYVWHISTGIHGHLTLTGFAGSCSADASVIGVDGSLVLTGNAGHVVTDDFVIGQTGNLTLTGNVSGVVTDDFVIGQTGSLVLTGNSAAVIANYILESASWSANLKTFAHVRYTNFDFNSLSGGYGCKSDGIYLLQGNTDNGAVINCSVDTGKTDFQSPQLKRMIDAYLGIDADGGNIQLNLITENADTTYTVTSSQNLQTNKIQLGRGAVGRYWQAILKNVNGAAFVMDSIELNAEILNRKVRGTASQAVVVNPVPTDISDEFITLIADQALGGHRVLIATLTGCDYADATNLAHLNKVIGITTQAWSKDDSVRIFQEGEITEPSWNFNIGSVFVGSSGLLTQDLTGLVFVQQIATAITPTKLLINIQPPILLS